MNKSGFIAIVGRPNVGKSTLLNAMIGETLAGVSDKPQTTRGMVRGILTRDEGQAVFLDTPGHHVPKDSLGDWMLGQISQALESADLIYWMVTPHLPKAEDKKILKLAVSSKVPIFLVVNKVDKYGKPQVLPVLEAYQDMFGFKEFIPISAKTELQVDLLIEKTFEYLPEGEPFFPEDQISDQQERFFMQEIIREKVFRLTQKEIPYSTCVKIEKVKERNEKILDVEATIFVERASQRKIVIGKQGAMLKMIGRDARIKMESFMGKKVFLQLWVKLAPDWKGSQDTLRQLGYQ